MADTRAPGAGGGGDDGGDDGAGRDSQDGRTGLGDTINAGFDLIVNGLLAEFLKDRFLSSENRIKWQQLAGGLFGGIGLAIWQGVIALPLGVAALFGEFTTPITNSLEDGGTSLATTIAGNADAVWDAAEFGFVGLPVNLGAALAAGAILAWGVN